MTWNEADYLDCLVSERRCYAWVMRHHGGLTPEEARKAALECYPYEPAETPFRGLVFHDLAWHWAMVAIHGFRYGAEHPELADPSADYRALE
ncbi:hypothetical protein ACIQKE_19050 [Streptomyces griseoviridis]|uniref:Uncharacterized protein n=2 Tax=Streptomyces TaxID=1883 RepID=A0A3S9ZM71_STRGD|nr:MULTISPECIES: hypothetical protein [Streptomyces]AZS88779.1 hypothetical protein ELQ87_34475 [Streptomyces griseoviridis]MDH6697419.1 hypothetical protein [Streptomyces sp. MAA16]MDT0471475.1 hypothetical protein [Streptomyces sp. DSM 41014]QCN84380.1 hypothetical protein DDJ31_04790 [Streptomyces griseoviridis]